MERQDYEGKRSMRDYTVVLEGPRISGDVIDLLAELRAHSKKFTLRLTMPTDDPQGLLYAFRSFIDKLPSVPDEPKQKTDSLIQDTPYQPHNADAPQHFTTSADAQAAEGIQD